MQESIQHMKELMSMSRGEEQREKTRKFLKYMSQYNNDEFDDKEVMTEFCNFAKEILPGRSEVKLFESKFNLKTEKRVKRVSFTTDPPVLHTISNKKVFSQEGRKQNKRESGTCTFTNTDLYKKCICYFGE